MRLLLIILLLPSVCFAEVGWDQTKMEYVDKFNHKISATPIKLAGDFVLQKPNIDETKILNEAEREVVEYALKKNGRFLIHIALKPIKNDYIDEKHRGTVEYTPKCRNYSFHKVIIPDGTTIEDANFTQREADTLAISGKRLTFLRCNLANNIIDPTWTLKECFTEEVNFAALEAEEAQQRASYELERLRVSE